MNQFLFISGTYRSGTTLIEKLLSQHPELVVGSQPTPNLFFSVKNSFLEKLNIKQIYPIEHSFLETYYSNNDFTQFLEKTLLDYFFVVNAIKQSTAYKGMLTFGFPEYCLKNLSNIEYTPRFFSELYRLLLHYLGNYLSTDEKIKFIGAKEIICEEFFPYLLNHEYRVLHIIRDPRDIINSLMNGKGRDFMGAIRPILYSIRMWRKSVAYAIHLSKNPNYFFLKYEDLVNMPLEILNQITSWLNVDKFDTKSFTQGIYDQFGNPWKGNSSFKRYEIISKESIGKFKLSLLPDYIKYIEAVCYPEMNYLGYSLTASPVVPKFLESLISNEVIEDKLFPADYSYSNKNILSEAMRIDNLANQNLDEDQLLKWYIFPEAHHTLRKFAI
jgi:hypothetical protein